MIKFDFHTHVGNIPSSGRNGTFTKDVTPAEAAYFLKQYNITHTVILYSDYSLMEELESLVDTKLYGVKWINDPYNDELDSGKPLCYGVKVHSHRSRYVYKGEEIFGLDYTNARHMGALLSRLQPGELVYMHTQESISPLNKSCPRSVLKNAVKYNHLKFIIGHAGHYGGFAVARPVDREIDTNIQDSKSEDKKHLHGLSQHLLAKQNTRDAAEYTEYFHNIFLDSSVYTKQKGEVLKDYRKWCIGSDFPFGDPKTYDFDKQVKQFLKHMDMEKIEMNYQNAINWIETPIDDLAKSHYENGKYTHKGTPRKRKGYVPGNAKVADLPQ
jgi:hypothetical protein